MRVLFCFLLLSCLPALAAKKSYSLAEVAKHATPKDCWLVIQGKVYDVSAYFPKHPAPEAALEKYCGKEADLGWETKDKKRPHSRAAAKLLARYELGALAK